MSPERGYPGRCRPSCATFVCTVVPWAPLADESTCRRRVYIQTIWTWIHRAFQFRTLYIYRLLARILTICFRPIYPSTHPSIHPSVHPSIHHPSTTHLPPIYPPCTSKHTHTHTHPLAALPQPPLPLAPDRLPRTVPPPPKPASWPTTRRRQSRPRGSGLSNRPSVCSIKAGWLGWTMTAGHGILPQVTRASKARSFHHRHRIQW